MALVPVSLVFLATQLPSLQQGLLTTSLTGPRWLVAIALALTLPLVIEGNKWLRRRRMPTATTVDIERAVAPSRGVTRAAR